jgi:hypothetical protein
MLHEVTDEETEDLEEYSMSTEDTNIDTHESTLPMTSRAKRELRHLATSYNPLATSLLQHLPEPNQSGREVAAIEHFENFETPGSNVLEVETANEPMFEIDHNSPEFLEPETEEIAALMIDQAPAQFEQEDVEPRNFREAWDHPNEEKRKKWREAIRKEFSDMNRRQVWRKVETKWIKEEDV